MQIPGATPVPHLCLDCFLHSSLRILHHGKHDSRPDSSAMVVVRGFLNEERRGVNHRFANTEHVIKRQRLEHGAAALRGICEEGSRRIGDAKQEQECGEELYAAFLDSDFAVGGLAG
jgi:hypothetical protein